MRGRFALLLLLAVAALAGLGWLAWRANRPARDPLAPEDARALSAPTPEQLAALDSAETRPHDAIEVAPAAARAAMEERTLRTRTATITVQPPKVASENRGTIFVWCYLESSRASVDPAEVVLVGPSGSEIVQKPGKGQDTFRGLGSGVYDVIVRDPRFETVRVDSVLTGSHVLIDLLGTAGVRVRALDGETGAAIESSTLRLLGFGTQRECAPDEQGWFRGLPPGELVLNVSAPGYQASKLELSALAANESREVELRFWHGGEIRGVVLSDADGLPVANVRVILDIPGLRSRIFELGEVAQDLHSVSGGSARSDERGRFSMPNLAFGEYSVLALRGRGFVTSPPQRAKLSPESRTEELVLRLPPVASLSGKLTCPSGVAARPAFGNFAITVGSNMTSAAADGSFDFEDCLPVGRAEVRLHLRSGSIARTLGEVVLRAGPNECSFDVSEFLPGDASVEIIGNGIEVDGGHLLVAAKGGSGEVETFEFNGGKGVAGPLPSGDYRLLARGSSQEWMTSMPVPLHIEAGKLTEVRLELRLARGRLELQDLTGAPLEAGTRVLLSHTLPDWPVSGRSERLTVAQGGLLELALEPGTFSLQLGAPRSFVWTASGPTQRVLRLPDR